MNPALQTKYHRPIETFALLSIVGAGVLGWCLQHLFIVAAKFMEAFPR